MNLLTNLKTKLIIVNFELIVLIIMISMAAIVAIIIFMVIVTNYQMNFINFAITFTKYQI